MCAFWFLYKMRASEDVSMIDIIEEAVRARPTILTKAGAVHENFLSNLLAYETEVEAAFLH